MFNKIPQDPSSLSKQKKQSQMSSRKGHTIKRLGGYLHRIIPIGDRTGKVLYFAIKPLMVELKPRDIMQIIVGASLFAIPVSFTEEAWQLGMVLPLNNVLGILLLSLVFISGFVYFNFYRFNFRNNFFNYFKRVIATYTLSFIVVALILTLIQKCPWGVNNVLAFKRIIIISFPACMSATLSDTIK